MNKKKERIIALAAIAVFLMFVILSAFELHQANKKSPTYEVTTINKDTGQTVVTDPNQKPEKGSDPTFVTILGLNKLPPAGVTLEQLALIEQLITTYDNSQLDHSYSQLTILNDGFTSNGTQITAKMRLGNSSKLLNLTIDYTDLINVEVIISDPAGNTHYNYDSGMQQIPASEQPSTTD